MRNPFMLWIRRARLALQEFGPYMALVFLPGGSFIALATWIFRHRTGAALRS
jgi:hypothetical protein